MATSSTQDLPCLLIKSVVGDDYVQLRVEEIYKSIHFKTYLDRKIQTSFYRTSLNLDHYITSIAIDDRPTQFCATIDGVHTIRYLTQPNFTLGLETAEVMVEHVIKNLARSPLYVFLCKSDKMQLYESYTNCKKALIEKQKLSSHFVQTAVEADGTLTVPQKTIYFIYSPSFAYFSRELRVAVAEKGTSMSSYYRNMNTLDLVSALPGCKCQCLKDLNQDILQELKKLSIQNAQMMEIVDDVRDLLSKQRDSLRRNFGAKSDNA